MCRWFDSGSSHQPVIFEVVIGNPWDHALNPTFLSAIYGEQPSLESQSLERKKIVFALEFFEVVDFKDARIQVRDGGPKCANKDGHPDIRS